MRPLNWYKVCYHFMLVSLGISLWSGVQATKFWRQLSENTNSYNNGPVISAGAASVMLQNIRTLFMFGGEGRDGGLLHNTWTYRIEDNLWSDLTPGNAATRPSARAYATAAHLATSVVIFGGQCTSAAFPARGQPCTDTTWEYDSVGNQWRSLDEELGALQPGPRSGHAVEVSGSSMFLYGGTRGPDRSQDNATDYTNVIWELQWDARRWVRHIIDLSDVSMSSWRESLQPRFGHSLVRDPYTGDLVIYGGFTQEPDWDTPAPRQATSNHFIAYNIASKQYTYQYQDRAPARAFHMGSMFYYGRNMNTQQRSMIVVSGHGRVTVTGVDRPQSDIQEYQFATRSWRALKADDSALPTPSPRLAFAGGVVDGTDVVQIAGSQCTSTRSGLLCLPIFNDIWAFDATGRRTIRGSVQARCLDFDNTLLYVERLVVFSQGNEAAYVRMNAAEASYIDLEEGSVVLVGYMNSVPIASGMAVIAGTGTTEVVARRVGTSEVTVRVLREDATSPVAAAQVMTNYWSVAAMKWEFNDAECTTNAAGYCTITLQATELPGMDTLPERARSKFRMLVFENYKLLLEDANFKVDPPPCCTGHRLLVSNASTLEVNQMRVDGVSATVNTIGDKVKAATYLEPGQGVYFSIQLVDLKPAQTLELLLVSYDPVENLSMFVSADPTNTFPSQGRPSNSVRAECGETDRYQRCLMSLQSEEMNVVNQQESVRVHVGVFASGVTGVAKSTIQLSAMVYSPLTAPPPPASPSSPRLNASDSGPRAGVSYVPFVQEPSQDGSLNAAILAVAIGTSIVVVCCAYYTVRFLSVHIKNVALAKQDAFITNQMQDIAAMRPSTVDPETGERKNVLKEEDLVQLDSDVKQSKQMRSVKFAADAPTQGAQGAYVQRPSSSLVELQQKYNASSNKQDVKGFMEHLDQMASEYRRTLRTPDAGSSRSGKESTVRSKHSGGDNLDALAAQYEEQVSSKTSKKRGKSAGDDETDALLDSQLSLRERHSLRNQEPGEAQIDDEMDPEYQGMMDSPTAVDGSKLPPKPPIGIAAPAPHPMHPIVIEARRQAAIAAGQDPDAIPGLSGPAPNRPRRKKQGGDTPSSSGTGLPPPPPPPRGPPPSKGSQIRSNRATRAGQGGFLPPPSAPPPGPAPPGTRTIRHQPPAGVKSPFPWDQPSEAPSEPPPPPSGPAPPFPFMMQPSQDKTAPPIPPPPGGAPPFPFMGMGMGSRPPTPPNQPAPPPPPFPFPYAQSAEVRSDNPPSFEGQSDLAATTAVSGLKNVHDEDSEISDADLPPLELAWQEVTTHGEKLEVSSAPESSNKPKSFPGAGSTWYEASNISPQKPRSQAGPLLRRPPPPPIPRAPDEAVPGGGLPPPPPSHPPPAVTAARAAGQKGGGVIRSSRPKRDKNKGP